MTLGNPVQQLQKTSRLWVQCREREVAVRIYYDVRKEGDCKIYSLGQVEELD